MHINRNLLKSILVSACVAGAAVGASAQSLQTGDDFIRDYIRYQVCGDGSLEAYFDVNSYGGGSCLDYGFPSPKSITIPAEVDAGDGYGKRTVSRLGPQSFYLLYEMEQVSIPSTIGWIRSTAFQGCLALKGIELPDGLWRIDNSFIDCKAMERIVIPATVERIDAGAFKGCDAMTEVIWLAPNFNPDADYTTFSAPNSTCCIFVPMCDVDRLQGWDGRKFALGPYVEEPEVTSTSVTLRKSATSAKGETVDSYTLNGVTLKADASMTWTDLEPDTEYTVTISGDFDGHIYKDALKVRTSKANGVKSVGESTQLKVYGGCGEISIQSQRECSVSVYDMQGRCVARVDAQSEAPMVITLPAGVYTVSEGVGVSKVVVK